MPDDDLKRLLEAMRQESAAVHAETRRHFDVAVERIEKRFLQSRVERLEGTTY